MNREINEGPPATASDAVTLAARLLRFQIDLSGCCSDTFNRDPFAAGYLWGFCGGILSAVRAVSPGLFALHSMVSRALFGDRDSASVVEYAAHVREAPAFITGERMGFADALRYLTEGRAGSRLVGYLGGPASGDAGGMGGDRLGPD